MKSTNIEKMGYDPASKTLAISFRGQGIYHYHGVSAEHAKALVEAKSHGSTFYSLIRNNYKGKKV